MLELHNISAAYHNRYILEDISLRIRKKEFTGIIGPNGAGKTTLLKIMTGIKSPEKGQVRLNGKNINHLTKKQIAKIMAVVPQSSFIPPLFTVEDVVSMGRYPFRQFRLTDTEHDTACVDAAIEKTGIQSFRSRMICELSGGQRQEVIIARALAQTPRVFVLDEPTANLDIKHQMKILCLAAALVRDDGLAAVMVIHDLNLAARFCDRLILLHDRKIMAMGPPEKVLTPDNLEMAYDVSTRVCRNCFTNALEVVILDQPFEERFL